MLECNHEALAVQQMCQMSYAPGGAAGISGVEISAAIALLDVAPGSIWRVANEVKMMGSVQAQVLNLRASREIDKLRSRAR